MDLLNSTDKIKQNVDLNEATIHNNTYEPLGRTKWHYAREQI